MFYLPQEIEVWYIIPAIRRELCKSLVNDYGFTLEKAGEAVGVSKSAVSQYISKKRGKSITLPKAVISQVKVSAKKIFLKESDAFHQIMSLLRVCKIQGVGCLACRKFNKGVVDRCKGDHSSYKDNYQVLE